ncbi:MAG TPA: type III pantothenate kinase [bacterium]|jgi:type III pantothenate kinase|nr:type III pantothenate kinase [bacterium]HOG44763.1 type III pantothenate kinase [bacterium]HPM47846.1 type III pantothenate kinase [bacterium]HPV21620.1 type III pantothenate kinase [bacterium]HPY15714.1 type III pantothenate kinase [bacterium]
MNFIVDIGNSNTVIGIYREGLLVRRWRIATDRNLTVDDISSKIHSLMMFSKIEISDIAFCIISSVVPTWNHVWERFSIEFLDVKPLFLKHTTTSGIKINIDNPNEVGADRIANAVAAASLYKEGTFIIDSGTAITLDIVTPQKEYVGGAIMPGIIISMEAMSLKTAKLPRFELDRPEKAIGRSTLAGLQSGVFFGFVGMIDRVIEESLKEVDFTPKIISTGGLAGALTTASKYISEFDRDLTLKGLNIIASLNRR